MPGAGMKLSLCCVSGKTNGTLCRWLHHVFISTGVKKIPNAACSTIPCLCKLWEIPTRGAKLSLLELLNPSGNPCCPPMNTEGRSEERRVGKECRYRWWPYHYKK